MDYSKMFVGKQFNEFICEERVHVESIVPLLSKHLFDPFKAVPVLNAVQGRTVCSVHSGVLSAYKDLPPAIKSSIPGVKAEVNVMIVEVSYHDGYHGFTWRMEAVLKK